MSLLDFLNTDEAKLGLGLLAAGGPSTVSMGFGQRIQGAMQGVSADKDADMKRQYLRSQMDENVSQIQARQLQAQRDQAIQQIIQRRLQPGGGSVPQVPGAAFAQSSMGGGTTTDINPMAPPSLQPQGAAPGMAPGMSGGSAFPFSLEDITALQGAGFKGADNLFGMYKYANDGVKRESGSYYVDPMTGQQRYYPKVGEGQMVGPDGSVSLAPGYAASNAFTKGTEAQAIEAAKYPYTVGADRSKQTMAAALDTQAVVGADGNTYYVPRLDVATGGGRGGPTSPSLGGNPQGSAPGGAQAPGGFMAGRNPITQQSSIALNDNWIKQTYQPTIEAGRTASDLSASIQALRNVDFKTGWGAEAKANGAAMLAGLGISPGSAGMYAANAQKFQSIAMDKLMTTLAAQKGTQVEGDANRAKQTFVSLGNTPQANAFILDFAEAKANMDRRRAQYYEQALPLAQKGGDLTMVNRQWNKVQGSLWADPVLQKWAK